MKLVLVLFVVFLVSADAKFQLNLGDLLGKVQNKINKLGGIPSIAQKIAQKLPFKIRQFFESKPGPEVESTAQPSAPEFCGDHDCPYFYEKKLDASDYTLRCYPQPYKWVTTTVEG